MKGEGEGEGDWLRRCQSPCFWMLILIAYKWFRLRGGSQEGTRGANLRPNGAGKTTFAREFLPNEAGCPVFTNADLIAAGLSPFQPELAAIKAGALHNAGDEPQLIDWGEKI
jgi:hypothetical protein